MHILLQWPAQPPNNLKDHLIAASLVAMPSILGDELADIHLNIVASRKYFLEVPAERHGMDLINRDPNHQRRLLDGSQLGLMFCITPPPQHKAPHTFWVPQDEGNGNTPAPAPTQDVERTILRNAECF